MIKEVYLKRCTTEYIKNLYNLSKGRHGKIKKNKIKVFPTSVEDEFNVVVFDHQQKCNLTFNAEELKTFLNTRENIQRPRNNKGFGNCKKDNLKICQNCKRNENIVKITDHHLVPKEEGGKDIPENYMDLCDDCHQQLHLFYTNDFLAKHKNTPESILNDSKMIQFAKFIIKNKKQTVKRKQSKIRKKKR